jgi:hypothetical protein
MADSFPELIEQANAIYASERDHNPGGPGEMFKDHDEGFLLWNGDTRTGITFIPARDSVEFKDRIWKDISAYGRAGYRCIHELEAPWRRLDDYWQDFREMAAAGGEIDQRLLENVGKALGKIKSKVELLTTPQGGSMTSNDMKFITLTMIINYLRGQFPGLSNSAAANTLAIILVAAGVEDGVPRSIARTILQRLRRVDGRYELTLPS